MIETIQFELNGTIVTSERAAGDRLLDVLRENFDLLGVKEGCSEGECGACAVIIDGNLSNSCLVAIGSVANTKVMTIEGFRDSERFKVLEKAFATAGAVQCGFCTPGMIMASESLLSKYPQPTREQICEGISGNLCRCTGYNMIIDAVEIAAREGEGLW